MGMPPDPWKEPTVNERFTDMARQQREAQERDIAAREGVKEPPSYIKAFFTLIFLAAVMPAFAHVLAIIGEWSWNLIG